MQDWLTNDQNIDHFVIATPLDVNELADYFQHYWQLKFKNERPEPKDKNKNKNNKRDQDKDN